jgi:hypothetical protein
LLFCSGTTAYNRPSSSGYDEEALGGDGPEKGLQTQFRDTGGLTVTFDLTAIDTAEGVNALRRNIQVRLPSMPFASYRLAFNRLWLAAHHDSVGFVRRVSATIARGPEHIYFHHVVLSR